MIPIEIIFHDVEPDPVLERRLHEKAAALRRYYDRIERIRVVLDRPHRHRVEGNPYQLRLQIAVPGRDIIVGQGPSPIAGAAPTRRVKAGEAAQARRDLQVAIRDTFAAARRQLQEHASHLRAESKWRA
jgi:hypothetical protein